MILSALVKLILSIFFIRELGIIGIMIGTVIGLLFISYGRVRFIFCIIFKKSMKNYLLRNLKYNILLVGEFLLLYKILDCFNLSSSYVGIFIECGIISIFISIVHYIIFRNTKKFHDILEYSQIVENIICNKFNNIVSKK